MLLNIRPLILVIFFGACLTSVSQAQNDVVGKVFCGYQGWFNCEGDGSAINVWNHWSLYNTLPTSSTLRIESYPDTTNYHHQSLFASGFAALGNGKPSRLFSSSVPATTNLHFSWMQNYGIDGVALQRFAHELRDPNFLSLRNGISDNVKHAAQATGRKFYIMYDISLLLEEDPGENIPNWGDWIKHDWQTQIANRGITDSSAYAKQEGKPVVAIWGLGFRDKPGSPQQQMELVKWFQDNQSCYVIGGVPRGWRDGLPADDEEPGDFSIVYESLDMLSPWSVGGFGGVGGADYYRTMMAADKAHLQSGGIDIDYQPVVFPGFAWSNWGDPPFTPNYISREKGEFMWRQFFNVRDLEIESAYVAMFDEYDEATGICKTASDSSMIPTDQYFLTTSADGEFLSSDFYLRLVGHATNVIKGSKGNSPSLPLCDVPYSNGPVWFRTGFEGPTPANVAALGIDPVPDYFNSAIIRSNVGGYAGEKNPKCEPVEESPHRGRTALMLSGHDQSANNSHVYFQVFDVDIPVGPRTNLNYWVFPENELGRNVAVDLVMSDGTTLRDSGAIDLFGASMHPGVAKGQIGIYTKTTCKIGRWLSGKRISQILIGYEEGDSTGDFKTRIDDIEITDLPFHQFQRPAIAN